MRTALAGPGASSKLAGRSAVAPFRAGRTAATRAMAAAAPKDYVAWVKGDFTDPGASKLGDCPFCHRVLLTLEAKGVPYTLGYINFDAKPEWLQGRSGGKVPLLHAAPDFWLPDSDAIVTHLEQAFPSPSMASSVPPEVVGGLFGAFRGFLMAKPEEEADKRAAFEAELAKINDRLAAHGPLFGGASLDATDASTAPKLYHALTALGHWKGYALGDKFPAVAAYMAKLSSMPAWQRTDYGRDAIIKGWSKHMG